MMSNDIMSPFNNLLLSGIPWQATLFTEVQMDLGNFLYISAEG